MMATAASDRGERMITMNHAAQSDLQPGGEGWSDTHGVDKYVGDEAYKFHDFFGEWRKW